MKKCVFFSEKHLLGDISQKPNFWNAILFLNTKPLSITRFYTTFQKMLLVSIFLRKLFRCKNVFLRGLGQWSPAVHLNQLVVFRIGFNILRVSTIKMHYKNWTTYSGFAVLRLHMPFDTSTFRSRFLITMTLGTIYSFTI